MQIIIASLILIAVLAFIIYKVNNKFETREATILLIIIVITAIGTSLFLNKQENFIPKMFKEKYQEDRKIKVLKLSYERLNNKTVASNTNFVYKFDYIIKKDNKEFVCSSNNVKVKKIEDEYIFINFEKLDEKCISK
jgi:hypothetical protein